MKRFGVKELSSMSGVTVRTLHYYDQIGLLRPSERTAAGYRYYHEEEWIRLQQILFYRELDFPLKSIKEILEAPDFDLMDTLKGHKTALIQRQHRIQQLLITLDRTIETIQKGNIMKDPEELYEGLPKEVGSTYRDEAIKEYGQEMVEQAEKDLVKLGKDGFKKLQAAFDALNEELFVMRNEDPQSTDVQALIARHYEMILKFWGTSVQAEHQLATYAGLGDLYIQDERYTMMEGEPQPRFAVFLKNAMQHFVAEKQQ
ncbi:MAG: MerR family transcriptional regulator [Bacteroidota bacterium]